MDWYNNPYMILGKLDPVFDARIPDKYRRDVLDTRNMVYDVQIKRKILLKLNKKKPDGYKVINKQN